MTAFSEGINIKRLREHKEWNDQILIKKFI